MQHLFANVNGITLHYVTEGTGELILFVHGFPEFWYAWKAQLEEFGKDHQAVAPDLRGFNLSSKPAMRAVQGENYYRRYARLDRTLGS
jgi:pimeloyl-ACP methyl ester carboxylesterase